LTDQEDPMHRRTSPTCAARSRGTLAAIAAIAALALAACAPAQTSTSTTGEPSSPVPQISASPDTSVGATGPEISVYDPADAPAVLQFSAKTLYGQPTIVWFWAPWCPVCKAEAPAILDALDELPDGVRAIGIPGQSDVASMQAFVNTYGLGAMPQIVDADGSLWANFSVSYQPATALIAADGTITTIPGSGNKADFLAAAASIAP
jgi:thiol-disulfide isomerase/thioredoxin